MYKQDTNNFHLCTRIGTNTFKVILYLVPSILLAFYFKNRYVFQPKFKLTQTILKKFHRVTCYSTCTTLLGLKC